MLCNNSYACFERSDKLGPRICESALFTTFGKLDLLKVLLHCAIFSATCLAMPFVMAQVAGELHSVTGVVSQFFLLHGALHKSRTLVYFSQRIAATFNAIAQRFTPPATFAAIFESRSLSEHATFSDIDILILAPSLPQPKMLQVAEENCTV